MTRPVVFQRQADSKLIACRQHCACKRLRKRVEAEKQARLGLALKPSAAESRVAQQLLVSGSQAKPC